MDNIEQSNTQLAKIFANLSSLVQYKNSQYGNSALNPLKIFADKCSYGYRLDEKLSRIQNSGELRKNDISDLMGGLALICQEKGWINFDEFKD